MLRHIFALAVTLGVVAAGGARAQDGCGMDTDCKGDRICVRHECVAPPADPQPPAQQASSAGPEDAPHNGVPASYTPVASPPAFAPSREAGESRNALGTDLYQHHHGTFIRPDLGGGYINSTASNNGTSVTINGAVASFGFAIGGAVADRKIVAFHIWDVVATNPSVTVGSNPANSINATLTLIALGPEYTAYSENNFYFSISPALTRATLAANGTTTDTNLGFGLRAGIGKEWWVSENWGIGLVGHLSASSNHDSGTSDATWQSVGVSLAFSATYN